ncbi:PepSY-associated TM helix domain-containing protein [Photobacterium sp. GB-1]|uniref:PepSY-associated TM helix domain-containing protein n=1 Tax=Photobacterium sp. GB-1 TaxID=2022111 RepID=UPI000D157BE1|nr:PepSY-associated TM helix domain-containing protein [Photobacterium sp. GB-1]PSV52059.1 peptidase [Photobacterium sp. GB-1]
MVLKQKNVQLWARRLHIYISMALLLIVLFFAITGITLNRPELFVSDTPSVTEQKITIPTSLLSSEQGPFVPNKSALISYLSKHTDVRGTASGIEIFTDLEGDELVEGEISLDYKGPGYNAVVFIDMTTAQANIEITNYGVIALLNDLHKGRNSGEVWTWFIDITAALMICFVLTGVCLLLPKKKTLNTSMKWMSFGSVVTAIIYIVFVP